MTDKKAFGSFIKTKRLEKQYSQKDLADILFVSESAVSKWERGEGLPESQDVHEEQFSALKEPASVNVRGEEFPVIEVTQEVIDGRTY